MNVVPPERDDVVASNTLLSDKIENFVLFEISVVVLI